MHTIPDGTVPDSGLRLCVIAFFTGLIIGLAVMTAIGAVMYG